MIIKYLVDLIFYRIHMFQLMPNTTLDSICTIAVVIVALYNYYCMETNQKGTGYFFLVVFILLYSLFFRPVNGDFWHYLARYQGGAIGGEHWESFYFWLVTIIPNNYILWRIIIWLPAAIFIIVCFRLVKIPSSFATTLFMVFGLASYYYTRNALASSVLYLGMSLFSLRDEFNKKTLILVLSIALCFASWFLHKSMPMYIGIAMLALLLPFKKSVLIVSLIAFPVLYGMLMTIGSSFLEMSEMWVEEGAGSHYLEDENEMMARNWRGIIELIVLYAPIFYFYIIAFFKQIPVDTPYFAYYKTFLYFSFFVVYLSFLFWGQGSMSLQVRIYKTAMIPFTFPLAYYFKYYLGTKQCRLFVYLVLLRIAWVNIF